MSWITSHQKKQTTELTAHIYVKKLPPRTKDLFLFDAFWCAQKFSCFGYYYEKQAWSRKPSLYAYALENGL